MDYSMPGFPVHHHLPEFAQTHVRRVSDATQPSHPLSPLSPPALNLSQHVEGQVKPLATTIEDCMLQQRPSPAKTINK